MSNMNLKNWKTTTLKDNCCPFCDYATDQASDPTGKNHPKQGDISICIMCASICVFDADLNLRKPSNEEYDAVKRDPQLLKIQAAIRKIDRRGARR